MALFFQQVVNSLSIGGIYALMSVGYALVYSLMRFTNFAHSLAVTVGAYLSYLLLANVTNNILLGILFGIFIGGVTSFFIEITAYRTLLLRNANRSYLTIIGLGVSTVGLNLIIIVFTSRFKAFPRGLLNTSVNILGASISILDIVIIVVSILVLIGVQLCIQKTRFGLAIRAASHDLDTTSLMGIDTHRLLTTVFVLAGCLAGLAGVFLGAKYQVYPMLGSNMTNKAFISAVVGGLGSLPGAMVGSLVLATGEVMIAGYLSSTLRDVFAYTLMICILLIRPAGLMGKYFDDKA